METRDYSPQQTPEWHQQEIDSSNDWRSELRLDFLSLPIFAPQSPKCYVDKPNIVGRSAGIKCSFNNDGNKVILIIWEEGLDFDEDDGGDSLASGHGATTIVDIGKDDRNYGTNS